MKKIAIILLSILSLSFNIGKPQSRGSRAASPNPDARFAIIKTNKLSTGKATIPYTKKNRKESQFALDLSSARDEDKNFTVKISKTTVIVMDSHNTVVHRYTVLKKWFDKIGPQYVYDLVDADKSECSLTDYVSINQHHYISFRYKDVLETYYYE